MLDPKVIIFDFDGVIVDSKKLAHSFAQWEFPDLSEEQFSALFDGNIFESIAKLPTTRTPEEKVIYRREVYLPAKNKIVPYDGIPHVISTLAAKYTLIINSSSTENDLAEYLTKHAMRDDFAHIYGKETSRNKIEKFQKIFDDFQVVAQECIFITDTLGDYMEARELRIPTLISTYGYQNEETFVDVKDEIVGFVHTPQEILQAI